VHVAVISANLGAYDPPAPWPTFDLPSDVSVDVHRFTDETFPPRPLAMTSRLQCGIPKWWGWEMYPGYDAYIWIDASCAPTPMAVSWFLERLGGADIAVFQHPERRTIREEFEFMVARMARPGETYLNSRYRGEDLAGQYAYIAADRSYIDDRLYASTAFAYRPTVGIREAFHAIWAAKARWLLHDQLIVPYALDRAACWVNVIADNYLRCPALTFTRKRKASAA
jgi:hypothetical protein